MASVMLPTLKVLFTILLLPALLWAILAPGSYGVLFLVHGHWSALIDAMVVLVCAILVAPVFRRTPTGLWLGGACTLAVTGFLGFFHHFRDSGESGPLPFEWLNDYWTQALPLLVLSAVFMGSVRKKRIAEDCIAASESPTGMSRFNQTTRSNPLTRVRPS